jgi:hypothetical protein
VRASLAAISNMQRIPPGQGHAWPARSHHEGAKAKNQGHHMEQASAQMTDDDTARLTYEATCVEAPTPAPFRTEEWDLPVSLSTASAFSAIDKPEAPPCCSKKNCFFDYFIGFTNAFSTAEVLSELGRRRRELLLRDSCLFLFAPIFFLGAASDFLTSEPSRASPFLFFEATALAGVSGFERAGYLTSADHLKHTVNAGIRNLSTTSFMLLPSMSSNQFVRLLSNLRDKLLIAFAIRFYNNKFWQRKYNF